MANVQGDQSVLTLDQLMEHEEAVIVAEINDKPVIFKLSELLGKVFLKESVSYSTEALNMRGKPIFNVGEITPVKNLVMSTTDGEAQDTSNLEGDGWIVGTISNDGTPRISIGTSEYGEDQPLVRKGSFTGAPSYAPEFIGQIAVNSSKDIYMAAGLTAADWKKISA